MQNLRAFEGKVLFKIIVKNKRTNLILAVTSRIEMRFSKSVACKLLWVIQLKFTFKQNIFLYPDVGTNGEREGRCPSAADVTSRRRPPFVNECFVDTDCTGRGPSKCCQTQRIEINFCVTPFPGELFHKKNRT